MTDQLDFFTEAAAGTLSLPPDPGPVAIDDQQRPLDVVGDLVRQGDDGFLARSVTPHSLVKQDRVFRYADTVAGAMSKKWSIWWLDLFAGPGAVYERHGAEFHAAIPVMVKHVKKPFSGYVFSDLDGDCIDSLRCRLGHHPGLTIEQGDANDRPYLESLIAPIPHDALVVAYLDPEGFDLHLETLRLLAWRFRHLDLMINLPVHQIDRAISANALDSVRPVLEHPNPRKLLAGRRTGLNIRSWFQHKLRDMGYRDDPDHFEAELIRSEHGVPQYDLMLVSRSPKAIELYRAANECDSNGQRRFGLAS